MTAGKLERREPLSATPDTVVSALDLALAAASDPIPALAGPGRWWVAGVRGGIELHASCNGHAAAPVQRLTRLAAAPALLAVRLAFAVTGRRPFTTLLPDPRHPGVLAVVRQGAAAPPTRAERALFGALVLGEPTQPGPEPDLLAALPLLRRAAETEGAWTRSVCDGGDRARLEGLPGVVPDLSTDAVLMVIGSHRLHRAGDLQAGQAMQRVLLTARSLGLDAVVIAGPPELDALRPADVPGAGPGLLPQLVVGVGSRRGVAEALGPP